MIRFKLFFEEFKFFKGKRGLWKNPDESEISDIPPEVRAIATISGNLYVINQKIASKAANLTSNHREIAEEMKKLFGENTRWRLQVAISLVRKGNTKAFYIGDDEWRGVYMKTKNDVEAEQLISRRKAILKVVKRKNKHWVFFNQRARESFDF